MEKVKGKIIGMKEADSMTTDLNKMVDLARQNTDEGWQVIDGLLPQCADQREFLDWSAGNITDPESGLRDLAASVFEQTSLPLSDEIVEGLFGLMREIDENLILVLELPVL